MFQITENTALKLKLGLFSKLWAIVVFNGLVLEKMYKNKRGLNWV